MDTFEDHRISFVGKCTVPCRFMGSLIPYPTMTRMDLVKDLYRQIYLVMGSCEMMLCSVSLSCLHCHKSTLSSCVWALLGSRETTGAG